jgi:hypothetical protein
MGVETEVDRIDEDDLEGASRFRRAKSVDIVAAGPGRRPGPGPSSDGVANREVRPDRRDPSRRPAIISMPGSRRRGPWQVVRSL